MSDKTPACELFAGKEHDDNPPSATVRVALDWKTSAGEDKHHEVSLCPSCLKDKRAEFREIGGTVEILERY